MSGQSTTRLLRAAVEAGLLGHHTPESILQDARRGGLDPIALCSERERLPREAMFRALAGAHGLSFCPAGELVAEAELLEQASERLLLRKHVLPLTRLPDGRVRVAVADPEDDSTLTTLRRVFGAVELVVAEPQAIRLALRRHGVREGSEEALDAVAFLDDLLHQAWLRRASDVHFDPQPEGLVLRLRVDGELASTGGVLGDEEGAAVLSRVKVLAGLDIAERRFPQDGSFTHELDGRRLDVRVATIPTRHGERATLRLLGIESEELTIEHLGFSQGSLGRLREALNHPHGMVLLTGPTGSGKTTTLYAALREVASPRVNVLTVEDPVERTIAGVGQVQVGGKVGFAHALRSLLRHDPDVLMVGEIRDGETADIAVKAAMTGHMVLSSLHTNRAAGAPARLIDLGCQSFLVASVLRGVLAQRLVRRLCRGCRRPRIAEPQELKALDPTTRLESATVMDPVGCPTCLGSGYLGRIALSEALWVDAELRAAIEAGTNEDRLRELSFKHGGRSLAADGLEKVLAGDTSVSEALRVRI
ncbi:MAG: GspE/PulE family protein [Planctomycetota bacterium]